MPKPGGPDRRSVLQIVGHAGLAGDACSGTVVAAIRPRAGCAGAASSSRRKFAAATAS